MSLVSITTSRLYAKLLEQSDAEEVATWFVDAYADDSTNLNLQLLDLIFRCCGASHFVRVPRKLARNEDIERIVSLVENVIPETNKLTFDKCADKALKFFERFWLLTWPDEGEPPFIRRLLLALIKTDSYSIAFFCVRILSGFVTSILVNKPNNIDERMPQIRKCARAAIVDSFYFKDRKLLKLSLLELERWFELRPNDFIQDDCLCFVVWSLRDSTDIMLTGLGILERLLSNNLENLSEHFVGQCREALSDADITRTDEIFARVCGCCVAMRRSNYENAVPRDVEEKLNDHLYSLDEKKWQAAASYWVAVNYDSNPFQYLRNVIKSAIGTKSWPKYVEYFVDSLIDECDVLTRWDLFAELLFDEYSDGQVTVEEKKVLFVLIVYAAQRIVTKKKPERRITRVEEGELRDEEASKKITLAFLPRLELLFKLDFPDPLFSLKLATFLHFKSVPSATIKLLVRGCELTFRNNAEFLSRRVVLELFCRMKMDCGDDDLKTICLGCVERLKKYYETRIKKTFDKFIRRNFGDAEEAINDQKLSEDLFALRIVDAVSPASRDVAYECAMKLLREDSPTMLTATYMAVREACVVLSTTYVLRSLCDDSVTEANERKKILEDATRLAILFSIQLLQPTGGDRGGVAVFLGLCDIASSLKSERFPSKKVMANMRQYFLLALSKPDNEHQQHLMKKYLNAIDVDVLPMEYAYSALSVYCNRTDYKHEGMLQRFLEAQCEKRGAATTAKWMTAFWIRIYENEFEKLKRNVLSFCEKLCQLIYPVRSKLSVFVYECHVAGIDYASSDETKCSEFSHMLCVFSPCLSVTDKSRVLSYALTKSLSCTRAVEEYIRSLEETQRWSVNIDERSTRSTNSSLEDSVSRTSTASSISSGDENVRSADEIALNRLQLADMSTTDSVSSDVDMEIVPNTRR